MFPMTIWQNLSDRQTDTQKLWSGRHTARSLGHSRRRAQARWATCTAVPLPRGGIEGERGRAWPHCAVGCCEAFTRRGGSVCTGHGLGGCLEYITEPRKRV